MSYRIELTENFKKGAKRLIKKYASLRTEILELGKELAENPTTGIPLGNDVYKIRLGVASKNKGKAGGARVITFVKIIDEQYIYYPSIPKAKLTASLIMKLLTLLGIIYKVNLILLT